MTCDVWGTTLKAVHFWRWFQVREDKSVTRRSHHHEPAELWLVSATVTWWWLCWVLGNSGACSASVPPLLIIESSRPAWCFPRIIETYKSPLQQLEELKVLGTRFYCLSSMNGSLKAPMIIAHSRALHGAWHQAHPYSRREWHINLPNGVSYHLIHWSQGLI